MRIARSELQALVDLLDHECLGYTDQAAAAYQALSHLEEALAQPGVKYIEISEEPIPGSSFPREAGRSTR
jgi:hypothetical protein